MMGLIYWLLTGAQLLESPDQLSYPLDMQEWITLQNYPDIYAIRYYAGAIDHDHTDRASWEKLLELIDKLP